MSPRGIEVADGGQRARLVRVEELGVPGTHRVAVEFEYSESAPLELRLGAPALKGRIRARVTGLRAIHALRVDHRETIVHLRHTLGKSTAPCELRCPNGVSAQGPNHCLDCETAIGIVTICCWRSGARRMATSKAWTIDITVTDGTTPVEGVEVRGEVAGTAVGTIITNGMGRVRFSLSVISQNLSPRDSQNHSPTMGAGSCSLLTAS